MAFTLPDLPYDYSALEPYVDATTMQVSHVSTSYMVTQTFCKMPEVL